MKYRPLFTLQIRHAYYSSGRCSDFLVVPTAATTQLLKKRRCILKTSSDGLQINIAVDDQDQPFIALNHDDAFHFQLQLRNTDFPLFTDLAQFATIPAPIYTNEDIPPENLGKLLLENRRAWGQETLRISAPAIDERFVISGTPLAGSEADSFSVSGLGAVDSPASYTANDKSITLDTRKASSGSTCQIKYPVRPSLPPGAFAEIVILNNYSIQAIQSGPAEFFIDFAAKQAHWQYYLVSDKVDANFIIKDASSPALVFAAEDLNEVADDWDAVAVSLRAQYPKLNLLRFETDAPVTLQQKTVKTLQLCLDDQQVVAPLPNPALQNITQSTSSPKEAALYQLIKFVTSTNHSMGEQ